MNAKRAVCSTFVVAMLALMMLGGCSGNSSFRTKDGAYEFEDSVRMDSLLKAEDTLALDELTEEAPLPMSVDELFDDFIFSFDQSNRLQRARVEFPLMVIEADGSVRTIEHNDWHHHYVFLQQDFCTAFWDSPSQMRLPQDTTITHARLEHIFLHSRQVDAYIFNRDTMNGQWFLSEERISSFEHSPLASFFDFYQRFATDSIYQQQHLAQTLRFRTADEENDYEIIEGTIDADQWTEFAPELPEDVLVCINYGQSYNNPKQMLMQLRGISNGLQNLLRFQRDNGEWRLTEFEN